MKRQSWVLILIACLIISCKKENLNSDFQIQRFDTDYFRSITGDIPFDFLQKYHPFLEDYMQKVISEDTDFSDSILMQMYLDEQGVFADISGLQKEVSTGIEKLLEHFPDLSRPEIYLHVSGWNQHVVVGENYVSLSADYYLGAGYPLYREFFYDYQLPKMTPERMAPDLFLGWLMAEFPFKGNEAVLLDKMLYEGKLRYILSQILPKRKVWEYAGYTQDQYEWCKTNESRIWKLILEKQHLFRSDYAVTIQYLREAPYTATLPAESPGSVGVWLGFQIISGYMKQHPQTAWPALMNETDYSLLLKESKYRP
ncbi:GldB family lipoprotein [Bacteroidia bacterium]|nr:GldB family lipoprotein [Bacteroidia bacterium]